MFFTKDEQETFFDKLQTIGKIYGKSVNVKMSQFYLKSLHKFDFNQILTALERIGQASFPKVVDIEGFFKNNSSYKKPPSVDSLNRIRELEDEFTRICKQACANGVDYKILSMVPGLKKLMEKDTLVANELLKDYSSYKTSLTNKELHEKQRKISAEISRVKHEN